MGLGLDWGLLVHDSASGRLAESRTFSYSFIVSESPMTMFYRGKIHCFVYLIQSSIEHSRRYGARKRGYSSEYQKVWQYQVRSEVLTGTCSFIGARTQVRTWHPTPMATAYPGLPLKERTQKLLWERAQVNWPWLWKSPDFPWEEEQESWEERIRLWVWRLDR